MKDLQTKHDSAKQEHTTITKDFTSKLEELILSKRQLTLEKEEKISELSKKLSNILSELNKRANDQYNQYSYEVDRDIDKLRDDKSKFDELVQLKRNKERDVENIMNEIHNLDSSIKVNKTRIEDKKNSKYDDTSLKLNYKRKIELNDSLKQFDEKTTTLQRKKKVLTFWKNGFSSTGIPALLIDDAIPFMNVKVKEYLELLSNGRYMVSFDSVKETKSGEFRDKVGVNVFDNQTKANKIIKLSGGQMRLIDIATILTLHDLYSHFHDVVFNLLLFDEVFDSLDNENAGFVSNLLRRITGNKTIGVISHEHIDSLEYDDRLEFRR